MSTQRITGRQIEDGAITINHLSETLVSTIHDLKKEVSELRSLIYGSPEAAGTLRRPLVLVDNRTQELPIGDRIVVASRADGDE